MSFDPQAKLKMKASCAWEIGGLIGNSSRKIVNCSALTTADDMLSANNSKSALPRHNLLQETNNSFCGALSSSKHPLKSQLMHLTNDSNEEFSNLTTQIRGEDAA